MSEKKVIIVIVEGFSDANAIGGILKEYFSSKEVQFAVVHGDITSDNTTTCSNVIIKIQRLIDSIRSRYSYCWNDFIRIIHITDTDGAFTKQCVRKADVTSIQYFTDHIKAYDEDKVYERNTHKSEIMLKLFSTGKIKNISYRLHFNSCNLEHVLYNELRDFSNEEKMIMADDFADKYEGKVNDFIEFISDKEIAISSTYSDTCKHIQKDKNSLNRYSNMHLIFDRI